MCPTNKLGWTTRKAAKKAAKRYGSRHGQSQRAYLCQHCGLWHLTTKPLRK